MARDRGIDWYRQARDDLEWAADTAARGYHAQTCFVAQQAAEKAIKAVALRRGYTEVRSHSILEVARALGIDDEVTAIAKRLDQYYISSRYPDAFATGAPFDYFTAEQAEEALRMARRLVEIVSATFSGDTTDDEILVRPRRDPLSGMSRQAVKTWIGEALRGRAEAAYIFGSFARDDLDSGSDIDCVVVTETPLPFPVRGRLYEDLRDRLPALSLLVYTPEEFAALTTDPSPGFWTSVTREMIRVL